MDPLCGGHCGRWLAWGHCEGIVEGRWPHVQQAGWLRVAGAPVPGPILADPEHWVVNQSWMRSGLRVTWQGQIMGAGHGALPPDPRHRGDGTCFSFWPGLCHAGGFSGVGLSAAELPAAAQSPGSLGTVGCTWSRFWLTLLSSSGSRRAPGTFSWTGWFSYPCLFWGMRWGPGVEGTLLEGSSKGS